MDHPLYERPVGTYGIAGAVDDLVIRLYVNATPNANPAIKHKSFAAMCASRTSSPATCNEIGHRRLVEMMEEFVLADLAGISDFILENSRRATLERINALTPGVASGHMQIDRYRIRVMRQAKKGEAF